MKEQAKTGGLGLGSIVFLIFLFMKVLGIGTVAEWSWWWVTSPLWIPIGLLIGITVIGFIISMGAFLVIGLIDYFRNK